VISRRGFFSMLAAPFLIRAVGHENSIPAKAWPSVEMVRLSSVFLLPHSAIYDGKPAPRSAFMVGRRLKRQAS